MCLLIKKSFIAKEDIVCYKVVDKSLKSPCFGFQYELGKTYKSILASSRIECLDFNLKTYYKYVVNDGLHVYKDLKHANFNVGKKLWVRHNYEASEDSDIVLKCVIPKGSKVYSDIFGIEYATNCLKVIEICN